jgi:hypothetical protein
MPEKSGTDAALCVPLSAGPAAGATVWPKAGAAAVAADVTNKSKSLRTFMPTSRSWSATPFYPERANGTRANRQRERPAACTRLADSSAV